VLSLGMFKKPFRITFPGGAAGNLCVITGPGKNEPLTRWIFKDRMLPERFASDYYGIMALTSEMPGFYDLKQREIERYIKYNMKTEERLRTDMFVELQLRRKRKFQETEEENFEIRDEHEEDFALLDQGIEIMELGDVNPPVKGRLGDWEFEYQTNQPKTKTITLHQIKQYGLKRPLPKDTLLHDTDFFSTLKPKGQLVMIVEMDVSTNTCLGLWFFEKQWIEGAMADFMTQWKKADSQSSKECLKHGMIHPNVLKLIKLRRMRKDAWHLGHFHVVLHPWEYRLGDIVYNDRVSLIKPKEEGALLDFYKKKMAILSPPNPLFTCVLLRLGLDHIASPELVELERDLLEKQFGKILYLDNKGRMH